MLGTRIRVALLYAMAEKAGMSVEQIAAAYPHLTVGQIEDALSYARAKREEMEEYLARDDTGHSAQPRSPSAPYKGRPVVERIDPAKWPYAPDPDWEREWDESGD